MSLNDDSCVEPINAEQQPEHKRVVAKFRSLSVDKELELLWQEINAINDTLQELVEIAELFQQPPAIKKDHNPYV
jgi:hypothetical protein